MIKFFNYTNCFHSGQLALLILNIIYHGQQYVRNTSGLITLFGMKSILIFISVNINLSFSAAGLRATALALQARRVCNFKFLNEDIRYIDLFILFYYDCTCNKT